MKYLVFIKHEIVLQGLVVIHETLWLHPVHSLFLNIGQSTRIVNLADFVLRVCFLCKLGPTNRLYV